VRSHLTEQEQQELDAYQKEQRQTQVAQEPYSQATTQHDDYEVNGYEEGDMSALNVSVESALTTHTTHTNRTTNSCTRSSNSHRSTSSIGSGNSTLIPDFHRSCDLLLYHLLQLLNDSEVTTDQLRQIKGIGPVRAAKILALREAAVHTTNDTDDDADTVPFTSLEDLSKIGMNAFAIDKFARENLGKIVYDQFIASK
jgi:hypothetical protein